MDSRSRRTARKKPQQERARQTVAAIIEAAAQVFEQEGYSHTTTDRIAQRAGVSVGSLYQYFPGKDAILVALAEQHAVHGVQRVEELLSALGGMAEIRKVPLRELLTILVEDIIELHRANPRLHRLLFVEVGLTKDLHRRLSQLEDQLAKRIDPLLRLHPEVSVHEPMVAAWLTVHATHALVHDYIVQPPGRLSRRAFAAELVSLLHGYLTAGHAT